MADVVNRDAKEAALARVVSERLWKFRLDVFRLVAMENKQEIPQETIDKHIEAMAEAVQPVFRMMYVAQAITMVENGG